MSGAEKALTVFLGGLIAIGIAEVFFSKNSQTPSVLNSAGGALSGSLAAAEGR